MKRTIHIPGDKTQLICESCEAVRSATWNYDDFEFEDGTLVESVMIAHCDECKAQAGVAAQSSYLLREAREKKQKRLRTNVTISKALKDLAESRLHLVGSSTMNSVEAVVLSVLTAIRKSPRHREKFLKLLKEAAQDPLWLKSKWDEKVTIRLSRRANSEIEGLKSISRSDFVRRAILIEDSEIEENLKQFALV